jgi:hypothetical protein
MRAELYEAEIVGNAAVISCPSIENAPSICFGLDHGEHSAISVVDEENSHHPPLPQQLHLNPRLAVIE